MKIILVISVVSIFFINGINNSTVQAQSDTVTGERITDVEKTYEKWLSWAILQSLPVPVYTHDANGTDGRLQFGVRWNITPINISFNANKYVSDVQFFMVNPVRRFTGSIELFLQPEWATAGFQNAEMDRFGLGIGSRVFIPVKNYGETFAASVGGKFTYRNSEVLNKDGYFGLEAGFYALYGIFGLQFNYNFDERSRYNIGFYFKYF